MNDLASPIGFEAARIAGPADWTDGIASSLLAIGTEALGALGAQRDALAEVISDLMAADDNRLRDRLRPLEGELQTIAPTVTILGQVNSGKSSVISALVGEPKLLPSDVNPWTAVVTTVHINAPASRGHRSASFRFFDRDEWDRLMQDGGRLGEMARRAGAPDETARIEEQVAALCHRAQERLGQDFERLLGQSHDHDRADTRVLEHYVALGELEITGQDAGEQGRYADITRAADIHLELPPYPFPFSLQDTPGLNDPLLVRERSTLRCIQTAGICVMVLSAAQALGSVDLALLRLLSTLDHGQLVVFVNRIDELDRPAEQVPEIRTALEATLARHGIDRVSRIIFGSARWAEAALTGAPGDLPEAAQASLLDWARATGAPRDRDPRKAIWHLSGMPALTRAIGDRLSEGAPHHALQRVRQDLRNVVTQGFAEIGGVGGLPGADRVFLTEGEVQARLRSLSADLLSGMDSDLSGIRDELRGRLRAASRQFVDATVAAMLRHIEVYGIEGQWECDPMRLRVQLRAAYMQFARAVRASGAKHLTRAAADASAIYRDLLGPSGAHLQLEAPVVPQVPAPVAIGKAIVVDLQGGWWKRWLKLRRGAKAFAGEYRSLITAEVDVILAEIETEHVAVVAAALRLSLEEFLGQQAQTLLAIAREGRVSGIGQGHAAVIDRHRDLRERLMAAQARLGGALAAPAA